MQQQNDIFNSIVQENSAGIYRICKAYLYDKSHVDDLYQEILLQVWKSLDSYKGAAKIGTWIYRIAVNTAITFNAQHKKARFNELPEQVDIADEPQSATKEKESRLTQLSDAIDQLEETDRIIISLVLEGLSYKEIAEITGGNTNNIGVRITRIKTKLLKLMDNQNDV